MRLRIIIGSMCVAALLTGSLSADTKFTEAVSNLWSNADNWSNGLPGPDDKIQFNGNTLCILDYDAGVVGNNAMEGSDPTHLRLVDGAVLNTSNWSIIGYAGIPEEPHLLEVLGGVYNSEIRMKIGFNGYGKLVVDYGGIVNVLSQEFDIAENAGSHGIVELRGGALNLLTSASEPLRFRRYGNATASMDFSGGILTLRYSDAQVANIDDHIADGTITAYGGVGTVVVDTGDANDYIHVTGLHPLNPVPEDGSTVLPGAVTLSWTVEAGTPVDVWFGTGVDLSGAKLIVDKQAVTSVAVKVDPKQRYYWAVDTYAPGAQDPNWGPIFDFLMDNVPPTVKAADDVTTWLDDGSREVAISAAVDDSDPTTTLWTVASEPNEGTAVIANAAQLETTVTLTETGTYVLQIEASDGEYSGSDTVTINVFANSCLAAQSLPGYVPIPGDINLDCVVDQADIDLLLEQWLNCNGLDCPDIDPNLP